MTIKINKIVLNQVIILTFRTQLFLGVSVSVLNSLLHLSIANCLLLNIYIIVVIAINKYIIKTPIKNHPYILIPIGPFGVFGVFGVILGREGLKYACTG
jgi:hypothetical protein